MTSPFTKDYEHKIGVVAAFPTFATLGQSRKQGYLESAYSHGKSRRLPP